MTMADQKTCPDCEGPNSDADLCHAEPDADGLRARCVNEWSDEKLFYVRNYATIFSKGMKNKWANRVYLDLFAGPGRYRVKPTGRFEDGSPLIALGLPFTHLFFSDLSAEVTSALQQRVNTRVHDDQYARVLEQGLAPPGIIDEIRGRQGGWPERHDLQKATRVEGIPLGHEDGRGGVESGGAAYQLFHLGSCRGIEWPAR